MNITYNELANYNNGALIWKTFDLENVTKEEHYTELTDWLESLPPVHGCPCEEWNVADAEGVPSTMVGDYGISDEFFEIQEYIGAAEADADAVHAYMSNFHSWNAEHFEESYCGHYASDWSDSPMDQFSREMFTECNDIPESLENYIDWDAVSRDFGYEYCDVDGHIFRSC